MKLRLTGRNLAIAFSLLVFFVSCGKDPVKPPETPPSDYIDLKNQVVKRGQPAVRVDLNSDGIIDLLFGVILVGDPIYKIDKTQYAVSSSFETNLPMNTNEETAVFNKEQNIPLENFENFSWYNASLAILMQKHLNENNEVSWHGNWKGLSSKYLSVKVLKGGKRYSGWIELTADITGERIILHRAAISRLPEREVKAGL